MDASHISTESDIKYMEASLICGLDSPLMEEVLVKQQPPGMGEEKTYHTELRLGCIVSHDYDIAECVGRSNIERYTRINRYALNHIVPRRENDTGELNVSPIVSVSENRKKNSALTGVAAAPTFRTFAATRRDIARADLKKAILCT